MCIRDRHRGIRHHVLSKFLSIRAQWQAAAPALAAKPAAAYHPPCFPPEKLRRPPCRMPRRTAKAQKPFRSTGGTAAEAAPPARQAPPCGNMRGPGLCAQPAQQETGMPHAPCALMLSLYTIIVYKKSISAVSRLKPQLRAGPALFIIERNITRKEEQCYEAGHLNLHA